jgi:hypothetical protein
MICLATAMASTIVFATGCSGDADFDNAGDDQAEGNWTPSANVGAKSVKTCTSCDANYARWWAGGEEWCMCTGAGTGTGTGGAGSGTCPNGNFCIFEHNDYAGGRRDVAASGDIAADFNDKASSWINETDRYVCAYENIGRAGRSISVAPRSRAAVPGDFNDIMSSILITDGGTAPACGTATSAPAGGWIDMTNNPRACENKAGTPCGWSPTNNNAGFTCGNRRSTWAVPWTCEK